MKRKAPTKKVIFERSIQKAISKLAIDRFKMAFLSGPRQAGKTTLAKSFLPNPQDGLNYGNWDQPIFRKKWLTSSDIIAREVIQSGLPILILDEFHKNPKWKNQLKGFYDEYGAHIQILVTGSAHLNTFRKGADSLLGRFFHFHILPLTIGELSKPSPFSFSDFSSWLQTPMSSKKTKGKNRKNENTVESLMQFGGFPEPFFEKSNEIYQIWSQSRLELLRVCSELKIKVSGHLSTNCMD